MFRNIIIGPFLDMKMVNFKLFGGPCLWKNSFSLQTEDDKKKILKGKTTRKLGRVVDL